MRTVSLSRRGETARVPSPAAGDRRSAATGDTRPTASLGHATTPGGCRKSRLPSTVGLPAPRSNDVNGRETTTPTAW